MENKPIVEYLEHMACPPTASRKETKRKKDYEYLFRSLIGHNVLGYFVCVCALSADAKGSGRRRAGTLHSINK